MLPFIAVSAIKMGMFASPLSLIASAANTYNQTVQKPDDKIGDILPLLPGIEKLNVEVKGPDSVTFTLQKQDVRSCAEQYLRREFSSDGALGARGGPPSPSGNESQFDYVLRLPSRNVYLKMEKELSEEKAVRFRGAARSLNPAEVLIVADNGVKMDELFDPVFVSENRVMRGRLRTVSTPELLSAFLGGRFSPTFELLDGEAVRVTAEFAKRVEP